MKRVKIKSKILFWHHYFIKKIFDFFDNETIIKAIKKLGYNIEIEITKKQKNDDTRYKTLSKFLNDDDTLDFYNNLTLEELDYLGY